MERVTRANRKEWAREHFRGFENVTLPSFTPDLKQLDEEGIRLDIRKAIEHGFFSTLAAAIALSEEEERRFLEICVDEAGEKMAIAATLGHTDLPGSIRKAQVAEEVGCQHAIVSLPPEGTQDDLYAYATQICESTNMGIYLWHAQIHKFDRFHISAVPFELFDRLADVPNIIALKVGNMNPATLFELFERYNDRMLIGALWLNIMPMTVSHYGQQWSGAWTVEALQSPEQPHAVEFFDHLMAGRKRQAMQLYWDYLQPGFMSMMKMMAPLIPSGGHPWDHMKYYQFAVGGNGGRMREDPEFPNLPPVSPEDRARIHATYKAMDIEPTDLPLEAFQVGRTNWQQSKKS